MSTSSSITPSRAWYLLALAILILGPLWSIYIAIHGFAVSFEHKIKFKVPSSTVLMISKTGRYTLWTEHHPNAKKSKRDVNEYITVRSFDTGQTLKIKPETAHQIDIHEKRPHALGDIDFTQPGNYQIHILATAPQRTISLHYPNLGQLFMTLAKAILLFVLSIIVSMVIFFTVLIKRANARVAQQATETPAPGTATTATAPPAAATLELSSQGRVWAMVCHITALCGYFIPLANIVVPLVIWLMKRHESPFVDQHGKESLNFQISMTIYYIISSILIILFIGLLLLPLLTIFNIIVIIIASVDAANGKAFRYPLSIRFIK